MDYLVQFAVWGLGVIGLLSALTEALFRAYAIETTILSLPIG